MCRAGTSDSAEAASAPAEAASAVEAGGEGVGLLRTEFLFLGRDQAPTEDEQAAAYTEMVRALNGLPIIIRTLDIGGDKRVPYLNMPAEDNPFLGWRALRYCLDHPEIFLPQLRAILRAAAHGNVRILIPLISGIDEVEQALRLLDDHDDLKEVLGSRFVRAYHAVKSHEFEMFNKVISSWEREHLLLNV